MRLTAREARRITDKVNSSEISDATEQIEFVCQSIEYAARRGKVDATFTPNVFQQTREWLELNGYSVENDGDTSIVSWGNALL